MVLGGGLASSIFPLNYFEQCGYIMVCQFFSHVTRVTKRIQL